MLRHRSYFEALSTLEENSPAWVSTLSGLAVLNLIDAVRDDKTLIERDWTSTRTVGESVAAIREGSPVKRPLTAIMDEIRGGLRWSELNRSLFAYGRALDLDGSFKLAVDVFETVSEMARADRDASLAIEATTALGGSARRSGDWERSNAGYAEAAYLADRLGDKASGLTVRVGTANTEMARGNLPQAQAILEEVIEEASKSRLDAVLALAYHSRATVAHHRRQFAESVTYGYKALELTTNPTAKDGIISDIAASFAEIGMRDAARDAQMVLSLTSRYQWTRSQASINLMELAALDGMEDAFESYGRELSNAPLDPRLRSYYLLYYGQGLLRFEKFERASSMLSEALAFASMHKVNQVAFEAEKSLEDAQKKTRLAVAVPTPREPVSTEIRQVADAFRHLRDAALTSPRGNAWMS
jgi:tetratricopeptide (TPR) repeat protein